jgi:hypothetical protein
MRAGLIYHHFAMYQDEMGKASNNQRVVQIQQASENHQCEGLFLMFEP